VYASWPLVWQLGFGLPGHADSYLHQRKYKTKNMKLFLPLVMFLLPLEAFGQRHVHQNNYKVEPVNNLQAMVAEDMQTTWLELVRRIFPGARFDATLHQTTAIRSIPLRHLWQSDEHAMADRPLVIEKAYALWFMSDGKEHLALLIQATHTEKVDSGRVTSYALAVFRFAPGPLLVDAVNPQKARNDHADFNQNTPLIFIDKGERDYAFFLTSARQTAPGSTERDLVLVDLQKRRLHLVSDYFSEQERETGEYKMKQVWAHSERQGRKARYLSYNFYFNERREPASKESAFIASQRQNSYEMYWNAKDNHYRMKLMKIASSSSIPSDLEPKDIIDFHGQALDVGRSYAGQVRFNGREWKLVNPFNYGAVERNVRIRWLDDNRVLPATEIGRGAWRRTLVFGVSGEKTSYRGNLPRGTTYELVPLRVEK
jgi:hypothetical protein